MNVHPVPCGPAVNGSGRKTFALLKGRLISESGDDEWLLLANPTPSATRRRQSDEIDIVAIGPPGDQVVEVKHWTEVRIGRNPEPVEQEAGRVTNKARRIGTTPRRHVRSLPQVHGVFPVTGAASRLAASEGCGPVGGVPIHTLKTWRDMIGLHARRVLSSARIGIPGAALEPGSVVAMDGALKRMAGMTRSLTIDYGDEVLLALGMTPDDFAKEAGMLIAVKLYEMGRLSSGAAAELANLPKPLFLAGLAA